MFIAIMLRTIDALRYSIDSLEKQPDTNADNIIIFLSDGRPTNIVDGVGIEIPEEEFDYSLVDEAASKGIRIYTIGLTENVNENILKEMANRTNGGYYYANTAEELISYFLTVNMGQKYDITTDTDEDGIPDLFETYGMPVANGQVVFTDPEKKDTDGDSLEDGEELIMHIVDDADEVETAYKYMYDYIPDILISSNGGIYFQMTSDPADADTDDDLDPDNADPNPISHQLNGYFAQKIGELQKAAQEYYNNSYITSPSDDYYGRKDIWLVFSFLRCFDKKYNWDESNWNNAAGTLSSDIFNSFKDFLKSNPTYDKLYNYFVDTNEINAGNNEEKIELYHMCATLSAYSYNDIFKTFAGTKYIDNLCGWSGDFQTLLNDAYNNKATYNNKIGDAFYYIMGKSNYHFSKEDLYSDVVSLLINKKLENNRDVSLEELFNTYFIYTDINDYMKDFERNLTIGEMKDYTKKYKFFGKKIDRYTCNPTEDYIDSCINSFIKYLNDNYNTTYRIGE